MINLLEAALRYKDTTMLEDIIVDIPTLKCKMKMCKKCVLKY